MQNYYQLFGIPEFSSFEDIQQAFNRLYAELFSSDAPLANIPKLKAMKEAFTVLSSPEQRESYDARLREYLEHLERDFSAAVEMLDTGRYQEAIEALKNLVQINPHEPDFYETLGLSHRLAQQPQEAIKAFQQGLRTNRRNAVFHRSLGDLYRSIREDDLADTHYLEAAEEFRLILQVDPKNIIALENLADVYACMKWFEDALDVYQQLLRMFPFNAAYHRDAGGVLYELDILEDAEKHLLEALRNDPEDAHSFMFLGLVYFKQRLLTLAVETFNESLKRDPNQLEVTQLTQKIREIQAEIGRTVEEIIYQPEPDAYVEGSVKWFNLETGIGVLSCDEYPEVLLHFSALDPADQDTLGKGMKVRFGVVNDRVGPVAVNVERLGEGTLGDTLPGTIASCDRRRKFGVIVTVAEREVLFALADVAQDVLPQLKKGVEVLFETKTIMGFDDQPVDQAVNVRLRRSSR